MRSLWVLISAWLVWASSAALASNHLFEAGVVENAALEGAPGDRTVPLYVAYPKTEGPSPVVVFSHGAYAAGPLYAGFAKNWAEHGYVVIAPTHLDSITMGTKRFTDISAKWPARYEDVEHIANSLDSIAALLPDDAPTLDAHDMIIAGHSAGGLVAMAIGGASLIAPDGTPSRDLKDPRFKSAIVISPPGTLPGRFPREAIATVDLPMLVITGTADVARGDTENTWEWRKEPYDFAAPGQKHLLVIEGGDHYLGGAMGRDDLETEPDIEGLALANAVAVAFLDAYSAEGSDSALKALKSGEFEGVKIDRAHIEWK